MRRFTTKYIISVIKTGQNSTKNLYYTTINNFSRDGSAGKNSTSKKITTKYAKLPLKYNIQNIKELLQKG